MFCVKKDEWEQMKIWGQDDQSGDFQRLELLLQPCQKSETRKCGKTKQEMLDYLGPLDFMMIHNNERIDYRNYTVPVQKDVVIRN